MWISKQLVEARKKQPAAGVSHVRSGEAAETGGGGFSYCGPWGVAYSPPSYARAVTVETASGTACVGTVTEAPEGARVEPGELLLFSRGGAYIHLKNNGQVEINGQTFAPAEKSGEGG